MQVADISRLIRSHIERASVLNAQTRTFAVPDYTLEAVALAIATDLGTRIERPVVTFTHADVISASIAAGYTIAQGEGTLAPFDAHGDNVYYPVHVIMDEAFKMAMARLPEQSLAADAARISG